MGIFMKEKGNIEPTRLEKLEAGDTFTFTDDDSPCIVLDEKSNGVLYQVVELKTGIIYRYRGEDEVVLRNYVLEEVI